MFVRGLAAERDALVGSLNNYTGLGSQIFADTKAVAEQALGRPIESGHTAVYAAELLAEELAKVRAERLALRSALGSIHVIAATGAREADESLARYWFGRIQSMAAEPFKPATIQVTDDDGVTS